MEGHCYERNNLWTGNDLLYCCILFVSAIVLCLVFCNRVRESFKTSKMLDESGIDVAGDGSSGEQSPPETTANDFMQILMKQMSENIKTLTEQMSENNKKQSESNEKLKETLKEQIAEVKETLTETFTRQISENQKTLSQQISESNEKHSQRFDRLDSSLADNGAKLERLESVIDRGIGTVQNRLDARFDKIQNSVENLSKELENSRTDVNSRLGNSQSESSQKLQAGDSEIEARCEPVIGSIIEVRAEISDELTRIEPEFDKEVSQICDKFEKLGVINGEKIREGEENLKMEVVQNLKWLSKEGPEKEKGNNPMVNSPSVLDLRFSWAPPQILCFWGKQAENPKPPWPHQTFLSFPKIFIFLSLLIFFLNFVRFN